MRLRVSDAEATADLERHLADQGFPARMIAKGELDVLFPGSPSIFAPAVELDLWRARHRRVDVTLVPEVEARCARRWSRPDGRSHVCGR